MTQPRSERARRLAVGAEPFDHGTHFRVWAPRRRKVEVLIEGGGAHALAGEPSGHFGGFVAGHAAGTRYRFRLDGDGERALPDPASRFQPEGPHGPSQVVDPAAYRWQSDAWSGVELRGQVLYEMHVGTFTREGTWAAATAELEKLQGVCTTIEMMPVAEFCGQFGWGYDGVDLFAPTRLYGSPDDLRAFVDRAHGLGLGVVLDVVYNHLGPDGNFLAEFSQTYFREGASTEWGPALNFDGEGNEGVREFFLANAGYWIDEFRFDGLRLDATHSILDGSEPHILTEIGQRIRAAARGRGTIVIVENEPQDTRMIRGHAEGGHGLDAAWNDDFHHSARVALTGRAQAYYRDHRGSPQELVSAAKHGYLFQGQRYMWQGKRRGSSTRGLSPERFVTFLENHDQVANTARGERLRSLSSPGRLRAFQALVLLGPGTPMIFQGEEYGSSVPFLYFADHRAALAASVKKGRSDFLAQFPSIALEEVRARLDPPSDAATFTKCKLDAGERARDTTHLAMHRDLVALRRSDPTVRGQGEHGLDGAVLGPAAFAIRLFGARSIDDRLLLVSYGPDVILESVPEPLLGPPNGTHWSLIWSSDDVRYGGDGTPEIETDEGWAIPGEAAALLAPKRDRS